MIEHVTFEAYPWNRALAFAVGAHRNGPKCIPENHLIPHNLTKMPNVVCSLLWRIRRCMRASISYLRNFKVNSFLVFPVIEQLPAADIVGITLRFHVAVGRMRSGYCL